MNAGKSGKTPTRRTFLGDEAASLPWEEYGRIGESKDKELERGEGSFQQDVVGRGGARRW